MFCRATPFENSVSMRRRLMMIIIIIILFMVVLIFFIRKSTSLNMETFHHFHMFKPALHYHNIVASCEYYISLWNCTHEVPRPAEPIVRHKNAWHMIQICLLSHLDLPSRPKSACRGKWACSGHGWQWRVQCARELISGLETGETITSSLMVAKLLTSFLELADSLLSLVRDTPEMFRGAASRISNPRVSDEPPCSTFTKESAASNSIYVE